MYVTVLHHVTIHEATPLTASVMERSLLLVLLLAATTSSVDRNNFKTCDQSSFCKRNRALKDNNVKYSVDPSSIAIEESVCKMDVVNQQSGVVLRAELYTLEGNMFRLKINEKNPLRARYEVEGALVGEPKQKRCKTRRAADGKVHITAGTTEAKLFLDPFRIEFYINSEIAVVVNSHNLFNIEHYRTKSTPSVATPTATPTSTPEEGDEDEHREENNEQEEESNNEPTEEPGLWEESFKTHHDSKPHGPSSVGIDISFPGVEHVYGIPEHADSFALRTTTGGDPYRMFNSDVFEYELNEKMALYGCIPLMLAHNWSKTVGVFWHNAAETWIDISNSIADQSILGKLLSYFKSGEDVPQTDTHWFSESGIIDLFIMLGPRPYDVFKQYSTLTGTPALPPLFAVAYHQSRWNYNDEPDVENVDKRFDGSDIPYDVLWLDIEHTDGKKYLTWDNSRFPNPKDMQNKLAATGRKMVTIVDPHIKKESGYHIHEEASSKDLYVKKADGSVYEAWCWPGTSSWIDFMSPSIRQWWAEQFMLDKYQGSTLNLFTWNDMNEPSVFNGPEATIHRDVIHHGGWENRDVHNIYGMFQQQATYEGHILRSGGQQRPFVLSRAFYAGTQRFGAIWTGDNAAAWDHLRASVPMLLSVGVAGLPFVGADVGGFFKDPETELLVRWYQAGAFYPFFRAHAHLDTKRREPFLLDEDKMVIVRNAVRLRYQLLPLFYTSFYLSHLTGLPVMRPLWMEFPRDKNTYNMEDQFIIDSSLMIRPVMDQGSTSVYVYMPGSNTVWYDYNDYKVYPGGNKHTISAPLDKIPFFLRGGSIIPTKQRVRRSSALSMNDPYTLVVALNKEGRAEGELFVDDGVSFKYRDEQKFLLRRFEYADNKLTGSSDPQSGSYSTKAWLERVLVVGYPSNPSSVTMTADGKSTTLRHNHDPAHNVLTIGKPGVNIAADFTITIN